MRTVAFPRGDIGEHGFAARDGRDIAVSVCFLALRQLANDVIDPLLQAGIASGTVVHRNGGKIVPEDMPGDPRVFPAAVDRRLCVEAGLRAKVMQQAVGFEGQ